MEDCTCALYGARKSDPINHHRFKVFQEAYGSKNAEKAFHRLKGIDSNSIPPCKAAVKEKIARTNSVARMWHAAWTNTVSKHPALGWELVDNSYITIWFNLPQMPDCVVPESVSIGEGSEEDENGYSTEIDSDDK